MTQTSPNLAVVISRVHRLLGPLSRWQVTYLLAMIQLLPEFGLSFKSIRPAVPPSELARQLAQFQRDPGLLIRDLAGPGVTPAMAWHAIKSNPAALRMLYFYARRTWGKRAEFDLGKGGDALDHLRENPNRVAAIKEASAGAIRNLERKRLRGRGGHRHKQDPALELAIDHISNIYVTPTSRAPTVSVLSKDKNPEVQIKGTTVEFLEICLLVMGFRMSRATLRRGIDDYRKRWKRAGGSI